MGCRNRTHTHTRRDRGTNPCRYTSGVCFQKISFCITILRRTKQLRKGTAVHMFTTHPSSWWPDKLKHRPTHTMHLDLQSCSVMWPVAHVGLWHLLTCTCLQDIHLQCPPDEDPIFQPTIYFVSCDLYHANVLTPT